MRDIYMKATTKGRFMIETSADRGKDVRDKRKILKSTMSVSLLKNKIIEKRSGC